MSGSKPPAAPRDSLTERFRPYRPNDLVSSIVALAEPANRLALDTAMTASRTEGRAAVDEICRLAVGAGVAGGEIAWLVGELEWLNVDEETLGEAAVAVAGMESCTRAVAGAVQEVADRGAPPEIGASAEALRRVSDQLAVLVLQMA